MNAMTRLLKYLDAVFGYKDNNPELKSTFRKVSEKFDETSNTHVILIEYRVKAYAGGRVAKKPVKEASFLSDLLEL